MVQSRLGDWMHIGFTGTRRGMTAAQEAVLRTILASFGAAVLHHGDCIGADAQAHDVATSLGLEVVVHPPDIDTQRAWKTASMMREPKPYLVRNKDIVRQTEMLIAASAEAEEQHRSGTWSTVRYARRSGRAIYVIGPDGTVALPEPGQLGQPGMAGAGGTAGDAAVPAGRGRPK